jgi:2-polyprenyl-3-methyl-5-hydroxy-6-metoxy-1,4-benzoquinol methylase
MAAGDYLSFPAPAFSEKVGQSDFHMHPSDHSSAPSPQRYLEVINAYQQGGALKAAIDLELFTHLGASAEKTATAGELAGRCQCPERGIRILCDALTVFGFLTKSGERYGLTPDSAVFLDQKSPAYLGASAKFFFAPGIMEAFSDLATTIRRGQVHTSELGTTAPEHPVWMDFARAMGPMMIPPARMTADLVPLAADRETRVLDISASHGAYGIAFAQKNPRAHLVALDWSNVLEVTEANAQAAGLSGRFSKIAGSAFTVDLGTGYDAVLVPNFLHHFNVADCTKFLRRVHAALRPGGRVVIVEFVPNEDRVSPPSAAAFSLVMLGTTPEGDAYTFAEYRAMLGEAGFEDAELHPLTPGAASVVLGTKK